MQNSEIQELTKSLAIANRKYFSQTGTKRFRAFESILKPEVLFRNRKYYFETGSIILKLKVLFIKISI